ncbi:hypothetical protein B0H10DRAFT_2241393 [Mycena sp. CBHHK59/15]|nr:hypothetical protein B0H10DRAFT_2241393 [Mycena sp. CBHHK59/15]
MLFMLISSLYTPQLPLLAFLCALRRQLCMPRPRRAPICCYAHVASYERSHSSYVVDWPATSASLRLQRTLRARCICAIANTVSPLFVRDEGYVPQITFRRLSASLEPALSAAPRDVPHRQHHRYHYLGATAESFLLRSSPTPARYLARECALDAIFRGGDAFV